MELGAPTGKWTMIVIYRGKHCPVRTCALALPLARVWRRHLLALRCFLHLCQLLLGLAAGHQRHARSLARIISPLS